MASPTPTTGSIVGSKYRVEKLLGQGGMGAVFSATNTLTGKRVAIKWMHAELAAQPESAERFIREAQASARVRHPNVVDVYDVVSEDGSLFLVMEFLEGEPLAALMEREGVPMYQVLAHVRSAMRGVAAAHKQGVIHRDIKPDNIFLAHEGDDDGHPIPKVLDFGISKVSDNQMSVTKTGAVLGTPLYMSVEQLTGVKDIDARTDIYAFGVILYQIVTGQPPFTADSFPALIARIMTEEAEDPKRLRPDVPSTLTELIRRAMARDRNQRIASLDQLVAGLEPFTHETGFRAQMTMGGGALPRAATPSGRPIEASVPVAVPVASPTPAAQPKTPSVVDEDSFSPVTRPSDEAVQLPRGSRLPMRAGLVALAVAASVGAWLALGGGEEPVADPGHDVNVVRPATQPADTGDVDVAAKPDLEPKPEDNAALQPLPPTPMVPEATPTAGATPTVTPATTPPKRERTHRQSSREQSAGTSPAPSGSPEANPSLRAPTATPLAPLPADETDERFRAGKPSRREF